MRGYSLPPRAALLAVLLFFCLPLAACGFTPVYSKHHGNTQKALNAVDIPVIPERTGQILRNELFDLFYTSGRPQNPRYRLMVKQPSENIIGLGIAKNASASRAQIQMYTDMELIDAGTNESLTKQRIQAVTSYNVRDNHFTTTVSETEARRLALKEMAKQIALRTELFLGDQ